MKNDSDTPRFLCVCLAPALDATVRLNAWPTKDAVIKNAEDVFTPGGKAINVARWLAGRGATVACCGLLGEDNAAPFDRELKDCGIDNRLLRVPGRTRVNEMFVTPQGCFKVNRPAFPGVRRPPVADLLPGLASADVVVFSGSLPQDWPDDTYRILVGAAKAAGAKTVLDASGAALAEGVKAAPDVIKPNAEECRALVGFRPETPGEFRRATDLLKTRCAFPIISDGASGCWFDGEFVPAPRVDALDTTAAGDTLLAEWCFSGDRHTAVAAGSAACTMPGGEPPPFETVLVLRNAIV